MRQIPRGQARPAAKKTIHKERSRTSTAGDLISSEDRLLGGPRRCGADDSDLGRTGPNRLRCRFPLLAPVHQRGGAAGRRHEQFERSDQGHRRPNADKCAHDAVAHAMRHIGSQGGDDAPRRDSTWEMTAATVSTANAVVILMSHSTTGHLRPRLLPFGHRDQTQLTRVMEACRMGQALRSIAVQFGRVWTANAGSSTSTDHPSGPHELKIGPGNHAHVLWSGRSVPGSAYHTRTEASSGNRFSLPVSPQ